MADTYKIKDYKVSDFKDPKGNTAVNLALEGYGEPVTIYVKDPSRLNVGDDLYGNIKMVERRNGNGSYARFYKEQRQDGQQAFGGNRSYQAGQPKKEYQPRDDAAIQAQWAIGQANQVAIATGSFDIEFIEDMAHKFYGLIDKVKANAAKKVVSESNQVTQDELTEIPF